MRPIRFGIPDTLYPRKFSLLPQRHERLERIVEPDLFVQLQHTLARDRQPWTHLIVPLVSVRNERVQPVVAPVQLDQNQCAIPTCLLHASCRSGKRRPRTWVNEHHQGKRCRQLKQFPPRHHSASLQLIDRVHH